MFFRVNPYLDIQRMLARVFKIINLMPTAGDLSREVLKKTIHNPTYLGFVVAFTMALLCTRRTPYYVILFYRIRRRIEYLSA